MKYITYYIIYFILGLVCGIFSYEAYIKNHNNRTTLVKKEAAIVAGNTMKACKETLTKPNQQCVIVIRSEIKVHPRKP